ncbi:hypothetical protein DSM106972_062030 [Dulcicalothrix desertica PCC 7102]|uniref:Uncharacterized protein n=1 Tax=Dulcicalothrix desertica PCC 7102 TaxID=232991 RepID=A0A3S1AJ71_9CYAN|nr:hypothetical protein [Dulcicalothrix desertica]RUT02128.1 hypothetical protein DSM106972_062030 [Dulcicalothrix desertica PCC 7102]TWH53771.1 hypothetical protein CAL7102_01752 [Dulcicalothrix desertica PCC 7102]
MLTNTYTPVSSDKFNTLNGTTSAILEFARALVIDKEFLSRADFSKLTQSFGWGKEVVKSYINIGTAFGGIEISKLVNIEPRTLFKITSNNRWKGVVEGIKKAVGNITQQFVEKLIQSNKKVPVPSQDKPTIWRGEGATRKCVIPPIKEDDQYTGTSIQRAMDSEGITAQKIVREAAALREAFKLGAIEVVGELLPEHLKAILGIEYEAPFSNNDGSSETNIAKIVTIAANYSTDNEETELAAQVVVDDLENKSEKGCPSNGGLHSKSVGNIPLRANDVVSCTPTSLQEVEKIAALLGDCKTWEEITTITGALDKPTRIASWELLNKEEQARILGLKKTYTQQENIPNNTIEETAVIKVGDKVIWLNCWPHLSSWNPFIVENIEDDFAKLNNLLTPVPVEELSLVS